MRRLLIPAFIVLTTATALAAPPRLDPLSASNCYDKVCVGMDFGPGMPAKCTEWVLEWNGKCPAGATPDVMLVKPTGVLPPTRPIPRPILVR